jgi:small-conductance mechanosensitive channel
LSLANLRFAIGLAAFAGLAATPARAGFAQELDAASRVAAENAVLTARIAEGELALERALAGLARARERKDEIEASVHRLEESAQMHVLGSELAQDVIEQLQVLPKEGGFEVARAERRRELQATSDGSLRTRRRLKELGGDLDAAVARRLAAAQPPVQEAQRPQVEAAVRERLAAQRGLLAKLEEVQHKLLKALREAGDAERELERKSRAARVELSRLLFWMPARPGWHLASELAPSLAWTISPANWRAAGATVRDEAMRRPLWAAAAALSVAGLLVGRGRLRRGLVSVASRAATREHYRIGDAWAALAITLALAAPGPILAWAAGHLLGSAPEAQGFAPALGDALTRIAPLLLALSASAWFLDPHSVAAAHFGWDEASVAFARRALGRFVAFFVPLLFVAALNGLVHAPFANRESFGRLTFNAAMLVLAGFLAYLFRRKSPLMQRHLAGAPRSWTARLHPVWFAALVAVPIGLAALAIAGYFIAAEFLFGKVMYSLYFVLVALVLYGLMVLSVMLRRARFTGPRDDGPATPRLDIAAIGEQARSLLDSLVVLLLLAGIWWIWKDALPVLSVIGDSRSGPTAKPSTARRSPAR